MLQSVAFVLSALAMHAACAQQSMREMARDPLVYAASVAIAADWGTTLDIAKNPNAYHEEGLIARKVIGRHPTTAQVNQYFIGVMASHLLLRAYAPKWVSNVTLSYAAAEHGYRAVANYRIGLRINF